MAYDTTKLTKLGALQELAKRAEATYAKQTDLDTLKSTVDGIVSTGGEANVIDTVKVNGTALAVTDKSVDVTVPTKTSDLTNDSSYQTSTEVASAIETAIAATGHASFEVATSVPTAAAATENVMYLVKNEDSGYYDIYALVAGEVVLLDDTSVDLSDYALDSEVIKTIAGTSPVTTTASGTTTTIALSTSGATAGSYGDSAAQTPAFGGTFKVLYATVDTYGRVTAISAHTVKIPSTVATTSAAGLMSAADKTNLDALQSTYGSVDIATDTEVEEMLAEIYGA